MKNSSLIIFLMAGLTSFAQVLGVDTLIKTGPIDKRINLVFMSDGYTSTEMPQFILDATNTSTYLLSQAPFSNYKNYFNVYAVKVASPQSGITHAGTATDVAEPQSPVMTVTNNFDTKFDNYGIHRLIYAMNPAAVYSVVAQAFPNYDQLVILGNSPEYGGAGGAFAVSSTHSSAQEIVVHEMGHSFAGLADEYFAGPGNAGELPNMTAASNTNNVKWSAWVGQQGVGIYPHDTSPPGSNWFKPHKNCKMEFLNSPFCAVCKQTIVEKIHSLVNPIDAVVPDNSITLVPANDSLWFKGVFVKPIPNTLKTIWDVNSGQIAVNKDSVMIPDFWLMQGGNMVTLTVKDTTILSKDTAHVTQHIYSASWLVSYSTVGMKEVKALVQLSIFPNPTQDFLTIDYQLNEAAEVSWCVSDMSGKVVLQEAPTKAKADHYSKKLDLRSLSKGNYIVSLKLNQHTINHTIILSN